MSARWEHDRAKRVSTLHVESLDDQRRQYRARVMRRGRTWVYAIDRVLAKGHVHALGGGGRRTQRAAKDAAQVALDHWRAPRTPTPKQEPTP